MTDLAYFIFPLVLAYGLLCFYLGYSTPKGAPRAGRPKTTEEQPVELLIDPSKTYAEIVLGKQMDEAIRAAANDTGDSFTRPEEQSAKP